MNLLNYTIRVLVQKKSVLFSSYTFNYLGFKKIEAFFASLMSPGRHYPETIIFNF
jgi:hypothetical protein